jgi:hypothetical protein
LREAFNPHFSRAAQRGAPHRNFTRQIPHEMQQRPQSPMVKIAVSSRATPVISV